MRQPSPRRALPSQRALWAVLLAFCTLALLLGVAVVAGVHAGLERLGSSHRRSLAAAALGQRYGQYEEAGHDVRGPRPLPKEALRPLKPRPGHEREAFDTSMYDLPAAVPSHYGPAAWEERQREAGRAYARGLEPLTRGDLVLAIVTDAGHAPYAASSRAWRQGTRTFIASNASLGAAEAAEAARHGEAWAVYEDDAPLRTLALKGDSRAALAPFLAHRHFGETYKWLFYGDDDTLLFIEPALQLLEHLDPEMPYFLTDHIWWSEPPEGGNGGGDERKDTHHPHRGAPRCVPCNYGGNTSSVTFPTPAGCPCTPKVLCAADKRGRLSPTPSGGCGMPRVPVATYSMHGGAGALLSVGLLKRIPLAWVEDCVRREYSTGGDAIISLCLWQAGYGLTDLDPLWHPRNLTMFDVGRAAQPDGTDSLERVAIPLGALLQELAGACTSPLCQAELSHFLTLHLRSRTFPSPAAHAAVVRLLAAVADRAWGRGAPAQPGPALLDSATAAEVDLATRVVGNARRQAGPGAALEEGLGAELAAFLGRTQDLAEAQAATGVALELLRAVVARYREVRAPAPAGAPQPPPGGPE